MKAIFLDIDGVLRLYPMDIPSPGALRGENDRVRFDQACLRRLADLVEKTGAKLLLSSSRRCCETEFDLLAYENLKKNLSDAGLVLDGETPQLNRNCRGQEIAAWLQAHPETERSCILEYRCATAPYESRTVLCEVDSGFTEAAFHRAEMLLRI